MTFPRKFPRLHAVKFGPFAIISLFLLTNFTGLFFSPVLAPAATPTSFIEAIPADIPVSGDCDLDWMIYRAGEKAGVDPQIHPRRNQAGKQIQERSCFTRRRAGPDAIDARDREEIWQQGSARCRLKHRSGYQVFEMVVEEI